LEVIVDLNRQTSLPSEYDEQYGQPSDGRGRRQDLAEFKNPIKKPIPPQTIMSSQSFWAGPVVQRMLGANPFRKYLAIQNIGVGSVFIGFGVIPDLSGNNAFVIPPNNGFTFEDGIVPNNDIFVVSAVSVQLTLVEGV
jgi:hypothetical protein